MNNDAEYAVLGIVCLMIFTMIIGFAIGGCLQDGMVRREAVKAGAAEWVSSENGGADFRWKAGE